MAEMNKQLFLRCLLAGKVGLKQQELNMQAASTGLPVDADAYTCVCVCSCYEKIQREMIFQICEKHFISSSLIFIPVDGYDVSCDFILCGEWDESKLKQVLQAVLCDLSGSGVLSETVIAVGSKVSRMSELYKSFNSAQSIFSNRMTGKTILFHSVAKKHGYDISRIIDIREITALFRDGNIEALVQRATEQAELIRRLSPVNMSGVYPTGIKRMFIEYSVFILHIAADEGLDVEKELSDDNPYEVIMSMRSTPEIISWFTNMCYTMRNAMNNLNKSRKQYVFNMAKSYISAHMSDYDLCLDTVGEHIGITPNYLSNVFSEVCDVGFSDYITSIRIEKAKELLLIKNKSIKQIAVDCGYSSSGYFDRVFKKKTGFTPVEYRKQKTVQAQ